ncbi:MAG: aminotransferase class I/II-fold pyridoxal phosphate-dependent enzyme, partial [Myxococcota bacterium]|nr:aminotransferase class I/II-fold pyridoxal phosphate-dependent enzyme [Myxococcota bacterium]
PDAARARIASELAAIPLHRYPDPRASALRAALAEYTGAQPDELVIGVGSDELIAILETAFARPRAGRERAIVLHPDPSFSMYGIIGRGRGLDAVKVPLDGSFGIDVAAFERAIEAHRPHLVFLPSPNNPTGNGFEEGALRSIVRAAPDALVVIDDAYVEFASKGSCSHALYGEHENVAVLGTLSKIGMAALRVGWVRARPWLAHELEKIRLPYNMPQPSQQIATLMLRELMPTVRDQIDAILRARARLIPRLAAMPGLTPCPTDANFVLVHVGGAGAPALAARLHAAGIQVRSFAGHPRLAEHVRITIGTEPENDALLAALSGALVP